jgi:hypothetical protein|tara:strand:- start:5847 stop:6182 length:336 start_codon:yes stop_codon:yes gene_type:complete
MALSNNTVATTSTGTLLLGPIPTGKTYAVVVMFFTNSSASAETLSVYAYPDASALAGTSVDNKNFLIKDLSIEGGDTFTFNAEKLLIDADDSIIAVSSGGNIQAVLSYTEI